MRINLLRMHFLRTCFYLAIILTIATSRVVLSEGSVTIRRQEKLTLRGERAERFTLSNEHGISLEISTLGASITSLHVPDADGETKDVVLGFEDHEQDVSLPPPRTSSF